MPCARAGVGIVLRGAVCAYLMWYGGVPQSDAMRANRLRLLHRRRQDLRSGTRGFGGLRCPTGLLPTGLLSRANGRSNQGRPRWWMRGMLLGRILLRLLCQARRLLLHDRPR